MLPLLRDIRSQPSGGNCSALLGREKKQGRKKNIVTHQNIVNVVVLTCVDSITSCSRQEKLLVVLQLAVNTPTESCLDVFFPLQLINTEVQLW